MHVIIIVFSPDKPDNYFQKIDQTAELIQTNDTF